MKPLRVSMQAFGPYTDKCEINFEKLNQSGIFLITGPTGSGKTTILDAMCFSLYGSATGENRQWEGMRNTCVSHDIPTVTEFEFSVGQDIYKFVRTREYRQKKRKSEVVIEAETKANAYKLNEGQWETLSDTSKSTTALATEILGFNRDQFVQVIVLPQGEFKKLLTANSTEKSLILETLFGAKKWSIYAKKFSEKAAETDRKLKEISHKIDGLLSGVNVENPAELEQKATEQKQYIVELKEQSEQHGFLLKKLSDEISVSTVTAKAFDELDNLKIKQDKLNGQKQYYADLNRQTALYQSIIKIRPIYNAYLSYHNQLNSLNKSKYDLEQKLSALKLEHESLNNQSSHIAALEQDKQSLIIKRENIMRTIAELDELINAQSQLDKLNTDYKAISINCDTLSNQIEQKKQQLANGEKEWEAIKNSIEQIPSYKAEIYRIKSEIKQLTELASCKNDLELCIKNVAALNSELSAAKTLFTQAQNTYEQLKQLHDADSAYNLSSQLTEGIPCPVCGSIHHPQPAMPAPTAPDNTTLNLARQDMLKHQEQFRDIEVKAQAETVKQEILQNKFDALQSDCKNISFDIDYLTRQCTQLEEKLRKAESMNSKREQIEQRKQAREQEIINLQEQLDCSIKERNDKAIQIAGASAKIEQMKHQREHDSITDKSKLNAELLQCDNQIKQIDQQCKNHNDKLNACNQNISKISGELSATMRSIEETNGLYISAKDSFTKTCQKEGIADFHSVDSVNITEEIIENNLKQISEYNTNLNFANERSQQLTEQLNGIDRPDLDALNERYNEINSGKSEIDNKLGQAEKYNEMLINAQASISSMRDSFDDLSRQYSLIQKLSLYLSGKNEMSTPIHQFVLGIMLEYVIQSANNYLLTLSKGQYSLRRVDREKGKRGYLGMEIDVIDAHRGGSRDVRTLSGGELFLASLSLAFGLSDTVQSFAGGISVDSLFIDEGFGTLDSETLETAMTALAQIRLSGRIIGIISHVDEIKSRIAAHIEIKKNNNGNSTAYVNVI